MNRLACAAVLAGSACVVTGASGDPRPASQRAGSGLELSVLTPDPASIGDRISLDVSFRGGAVETVELYLDGVLAAKRQLATAQNRGVITFTLDAMLMTEGTHQVQVKAYGTDGKSVTSAAKVRIPGMDLSAPVRIAYPQNGIEVSGVVPISVKLEAELQKQKPYVTFFVDKEFKVLRNFPPYEYNWDTTKVTNGWHEVEALTTTVDGNSPLKAKAIHVNVNNSGGQTKFIRNIPDVREEEGNKPKAGPKLAAPSVSEPGAANVVGHNSALRFNGHPAKVTGPVTAADPSGYGIPMQSNAGVSQPTVKLTGRVNQKGAARIMGAAAERPKGSMARVSHNNAVLPPVPDSAAPIPIYQPSRVGMVFSMIARPGDTAETIASRTGYSAAEIRRLNNMPKGHAMTAGSTVIVPRGGAFEVSFNGSAIHFDVAPRIENGMKLAPFRQIFEHTGGRLYWFGGTAQTVRAVNSTREIEMKIGNNSALVNNQSVTMDRAPFIESGRTIVPLNFIRDALNVKVSYDEKTGRLLIESDK